MAAEAELAISEAAMASRVEKLLGNEQEDNSQGAMWITEAVADVTMVVKQQLSEELDDDLVKEVASHVVEGAVTEGDTSYVTEEEIGSTVISLGLYDLTEQEIKAIHKMEEEVIELEHELATVAEKSDNIEES